MKTFFCRTKILSGAGSLREVKNLQIRRLLLVSDPFFLENGTAQRLLELSGAEKTEIFADVQPDPTVELAARGTAVLRRFQPDCVVALGGGSAIDCAKAMVYFAEHPVRLVAIPTTSGSGSEVTDFSVLTHGQVKYPLVDKSLCPEAAILDSDLLEKLPKKLIADGGFDLLSHALESYAAKDGGTIAVALAKEAFCTAFGLLSASYAGQSWARARIHEAATMAGIAFSQTGLGLCHAMAHSLGGAFHVPHGRLCAVLLPAVVRCNAQACAPRYAQLARAVGLPGAADAVAVRSLQNGLIRLRKELGMPQTLKEAGIAPREVQRRSRELVTAALADPCCGTNPLPVEDFMLHRILEEVTGRV